MIRNHPKRVENMKTGSPNNYAILSPENKRGCTIAIPGGSSPELKKYMYRFSNGTPEINLSLYH